MRENYPELFELRSQLIGALPDVRGFKGGWNVRPWSVDVAWSVVAEELELINGSEREEDRELLELLVSLLWLSHLRRIAIKEDRDDVNYDEELDAIGEEMSRLANEYRVWVQAYPAVSYLLLADVERLGRAMRYSHPYLESLIDYLLTRPSTKYHHVLGVVLGVLYSDEIPVDALETFFRALSLSDEFNVGEDVWQNLMTNSNETPRVEVLRPFAKYFKSHTGILLMWK